MKTAFIILATSALPGAALAQTVGVNGATCSFATVKDAVDSLGTASGTIYARAGMDHLVSAEIVAQAHHTIIASNANCTASSSGVATLRAAGPHRILKVKAGKQVELRNLWLFDGEETEGGNIYVESFGDIVLSNTLVGFGDATRGGSVYLEDDADLIMEAGSRIYASHADDGGAVYAGVDSLVRIESGAFIGRNLLENTADFGAGIYAFGSELDIQTGSRIEHNDAAFYGGGVFQLGANTTIWGDFIGNTAQTAGGGLMVGFGVTSFDDTVEINAAAAFEDNVAVNGGGGAIAGLDTNSDNTVTINYARFANNEADAGGAIALGTGFTLEINGGGYYDNVASAGNGGAINFNGEDLSISRPTYFEGNTATNGGALALSDGGDSGNTREVQGWYVGNSASNRGGAVQVTRGTTRLHNVQFDDNQAQNGGGAVNVSNLGTLLRIAAPPGGSCVLDLGCARFEGNSTVTGIGGAVRLGASASAIIRRSLIESNSAPTGSAMGMTSGTLTLTGSRISRNTDTASTTNAAVDVSAGSVLISNNSILGNTRGGARLSAGVTGSFDNNIVFFNFAGVLPGGTTTRCNDTQGGVLPGPGNISVAPSMNPNGSLMPGSAGLNACSSGFGKAIDGTLRAVGTGPTPFDMGCFEQ